MAEDDGRPVGQLESWSVYRANHGIYRNVLVSMKYVPKHTLSLAAFVDFVDRALRERVLVEQPLLSCVVEDGESARPMFRRVAFAKMPIEVLEDCQDIQDFFRQEHEHGPTNDRLWRVTIVPVESAFWVSFAFHHGVGDGTSGLIFHEQLLKALQELTDTGELRTTVARPLPPALEQSGLTMPRPWKSLARELTLKLPLPGMLRSFLADPVFYGGLKTSVQQRRERKTYMKTFILSHEQVDKLRRISKSNKISIHALLHGAAVHSIETTLPIKTSTPINLRPLIPRPQERVMANYACAHTSFSPRKQDPLSTARAYYAELNDPRARQDALAGVALLQYIDNTPDKTGRPGIERVILDRLNTSKDHCLNYTLEISNLGNWNAPILNDWTIDHVHFSGANSAIGELFCVGVATVAGGIMNVTCTASDTSVDAGEVDKFMQTYEETLLRLD